jgi:hypothetical protein
MKSEVLIAVNINTAILLLDVMLCSVVDMYQSLVGMCCLHLQGRKEKRLQIRLKC